MKKRKIEKEKIKKKENFKKKSAIKMWIRRIEC